MAIVGLCGFADSGKGTVADILCRRYEYTKISMSDSLKDAASIIFGWPRHLLEGDSEESRQFRETPDSFWSIKFERKFTPRMGLQELGTQACRDVFHQDIWIYVIEKKLASLKNVVIPDIRFPNEIDFLKKLGGSVFRVKRGPEPEWYDTAYAHNILNEYKMYDLYPHIHLSEWAWIGENFTGIINNKGTIKDLDMLISELLTETN